jgi:hypothetical protein
MTINRSCFENAKKNGVLIYQKHSRILPLTVTIYLYSILEVLTMAYLSSIESRYDVLHTTAMPMRRRGLYRIKAEDELFQVLVVNKMK